MAESQPQQLIEGGDDGKRSQRAALLKALQTEDYCACFPNDAPDNIVFIDSKEAEQDTQLWQLLNKAAQESQANLLSGSESNTKSLKAASINKLVERLTDADFIHSHSDFLNQFLYSYLTYAPSPVVLQLLIIRFKGPPSDANATDMRSVSQWKEHSAEIQGTVATVIRTWIKELPSTWHQQRSMMAALLQFLKGMPKNGVRELMRTTAAEVLQEPKRPDVPLFVQHQSVSCLHSAATRIISFGDPIDFACSLAYVEYEIMSRILPHEFVRQAWTKTPEDAPNLVYYIEWFNQCSRWIASQILQCNQAQERAEMLEYWIDVATESIGISNYNGAMEVLSSLVSAPLARLAKSWALVSAEHKTKLDEVQRLFDPAKNSASYRQALRRCARGHPALPYMGIFLTDLTFIDDSNPDNVDGLINWQKAEMTGDVIGRIFGWIRGTYRFPRNKQMMALLKEIEAWSDDELYRISLLMEPRGAVEDEQRLLDGSGSGGAAALSRSMMQQLDTTKLLDVSEHDWALIMAAGKALTFGEDDVLVEHGKPNTKIFRVKSGQVRICVPMGDSMLKTVATLSAGTLLGEMSVLGDVAGMASATVIGATQGEVEVVSVSYLHHLFESEPDVSRRFHQYVATKLANRLRQLDAQKKKKQKKKGKGSRITSGKGDDDSDSTVTKSFQEDDLKSSNPNPIPTKDDLLETVDEADVQHQLEQREQAFRKLFRLEEDPNERLVKVFPAIHMKMGHGKLHSGTLYLSTNYVCLLIRVFTFEKQEVIPTSTISDIQRSSRANTFHIRYNRGKKERSVTIRESQDSNPVYELVHSLWRNRKEMTDSGTTKGIGSDDVVGLRQGQRLRPKDWEVLLTGAKDVSAKKGDVIVQQGQDYQKLFFISTGRCRIEIMKGEPAQAITVGYMEAGETFGEVSMLMGEAASATVVAESETVELQVIQGYVLRVLFGVRPELAGRFYHFLAELIVKRVKSREAVIFTDTSVQRNVKAVEDGSLDSVDSDDEEDEYDVESGDDEDGGGAATASAATHGFAGAQLTSSGSLKTAFLQRLARLPSFEGSLSGSHVEIDGPH